METNKIIIFAPSMATLGFVINHYPIEKIRVLTYSPSIIRFCRSNHLSFIEMKYLEQSTREALKSYKNYLVELTEGIKGNDILFGCRNNLKFEGFLLKKLSKNNNLLFHNIDPLLPKEKFNPLLFLNKGYRMIVFSWFVYLLFFNQNYKIYKEGKGKYILCFSEEDCFKFSKKFKFSAKNYFLSNQKKILSTYNINNIDILFIDNVSKNVEPAVLKNIVKILLKNPDNKVFLKPHYADNFKPSKILTDNLKTLPRELPVEFFKGYPKIVIGFYSTAFETFSGNAKIISLIHFEKTERMEIKNYFIELMKSFQNVYYPKTIDEIESLISI